MASIQQVASQVVQTNYQLTVLQDRMRAAEMTIAIQEEDISKLSQRNMRRGNRSDSDGDNELAPKKLFEPRIMTKG